LTASTVAKLRPGELWDRRAVWKWLFKLTNSPLTPFASPSGSVTPTSHRTNSPGEWPDECKAIPGWGGDLMEPVRDYELKAFFTYAINLLERLEIP
jgi:hypothetical protein